MQGYSIRGRTKKAYARARAIVTLGSIIDDLDPERFREIEEIYKDAAPSPGFSKYLNLRRWMRVNLERVYFLGLHRSRGQRVLDIGTGPGYFPFLCGRFGHEAVGLDIGGNPMYDELIDYLRVSRTIAKIEAGQPVPVEGMRFDCVTAFMIRFHAGANGDWSLQDWDFFLHDIRDRLLTSRGRLCLSFNQFASRYHNAYRAIQGYDPETCENYAIIRAS